MFIVIVEIRRVVYERSKKRVYQRGAQKYLFSAFPAVRDVSGYWSGNNVDNRQKRKNHTDDKYRNSSLSSYSLQ